MNTSNDLLHRAWIRIDEQIALREDCARLPDSERARPLNELRAEITGLYAARSFIQKAFWELEEEAKAVADEPTKAEAK